MTNRFTQDLLAKRAGRACLSCRSRKIRCNVEEQGQPCSNCLNDEANCQIAKSKRGKKPRRRLKMNPKCPKAKHDTTQSVGRINSNVDGSRGIVPLCRVPPTHTTGWLDDCVELETFSQCQDEGLTNSLKSGTAPKRSAAELDQRFLHRELTYVSLIEQEAVHHVTTADPTPPSLISPSQTSPSADSFRTNHESLPDFIKPLSQSLTPEDVDYLRLKGALDIPSASFLNALLDSYIQYVYPYMPTTDLSSICGIVTGKSVSISILLLQAITFAAVAFVDADEIHRAGFNSRRSCRKAFYDKTRLLYDLDVEFDKLAIIQATLLMAYWNETPGDNKGAWHWMGVATSLAQTLGMHRKTEYKVQSHESKLHKRIWWSCYIRDRMLAIAMCRPLRIKDAEFDTPPLTLEDFDIIDLSNGPGCLDTDSQTALAEMCIKATELCKLVAGVVELHFSVLPSEDSTSTAKEDNGTRTTMLCLKSFSPNEQLVQRYDEQLQTWYRTLPSSCVYGTKDGQGGLSPCVIVNAASLQIAFWAVVSALHRPQLRGRNKAVSIRRVEEAAIQVSRVDREMHKIHLDQYLPATGIPFQFPAFITHTKRLENQKTYGVTEILDSLFFCTKVVETLRELFVGGDDGIKFITYVAKRADITLLFDQDSKLWGLEYRGLHYSPGSRQLNLDSKTFGTGFGDVSPHRSSYESVLESGQERPKTGKIVNQNDSELLSFDNMDANYWSSLSDILSACDMDFEHCFGMPINSDSLQDVEMG
ncbi:uncharacterized protein Z518_00646 [Rhinocladiella mackenziei CBS 650.93]|uniref:Rhinocladiella mackenziei CBS 650.93 unplaced genomic scaffold supercont1.1, whole genome shotgun sequence n=1 Tax=Rhinocladiella mackenziei CBS 650.93 TaxID=1442369 RepID=A0A0D2J1L9_9EURO|nr:uncharacterized protein Z518_00646 [Rhinocladiella mackenziei CBS 650.93]KIX09566.1 hypothetical protein Z518_00646 [Rhinocladiella mackenziei CBS 650.93]